MHHAIARCLNERAPVSSRLEGLQAMFGRAGLQTVETLEPRLQLAADATVAPAPAAAASISGVVYADLNHNGSRDPGEPALPNWVAFLDSNNNGQLDPSEPST